MSHIDDLAPCTYFSDEGESFLSVGWLSKDQPFQRGPVSLEFYQKLASLCREPWQPIAFLGFHRCELCQFEPPRFSDNIFVPHHGSIYVAPVAITHYICAHWYRPPEVFIRAVMECPPMKSVEYKKAVLENGGQGLVEPSTDDQSFSRPR